MNKQTKRKLRENLTIETILKKFQKKTKHQEIVAMWVKRKNDGKNKVTIEYFNHQDFCTLLKKWSSATFRIQKKGTAVCNASWSPKAWRMVFIVIKIWSELIGLPNCVSSRESKIPKCSRIGNLIFIKELLLSKMTDFHKKQVVNLILVQLKGNSVSNLIEQIIYNLVTHIENIERKKIKRIELYFKVFIL